MLARELEMQVAVLAQVTRAGGQAGEAAAFETYTAIISRAWAAREA
jgi:hypothetical protein